jgi:cytochrome c-type biogenesis protein CcmF
MAAFGSFALLLALALAVYNLLAGALALRLMAEGRSSAWRLAESARRAGIAGFAAVTAAALALIRSVFANDFSLTYILEHSNRALPGLYKFSALWSGQEGSLLLWAWLLAGYGFVLRLRRQREVKLYTCASSILAGVQLFFLAVLNFAAPPFALLQRAVPADGNGLNPLLQYPEMAIHPPLLYLGYVGFAAPFAFALAALMVRSPGEVWLPITRRWTLLAWLFLTCGVFLGMHWAYAVLGWGGYWSWDPVENASLMPWLTATAFLHSAILQQKKGMMKSWSIWLIFSTFLLTLLGTLLTRGGLVSSVHAFAESPIGYWFIAFLVLVLALCLFTYILRREDCQSAARVEQLLSREASFLFNNLVLVAACLVILWGTLFPVLSMYFVGNKVTMDASFYNGVTVPIGLFLLLLIGVGPLLPWRAASLRSLRRRFVLPCLAVWLVVALCLLMGVRPWKGGVFDRGSFYALIAFALAAGVATATLAEFLRGARILAQQSRRNYFAALYLLVRGNNRRYGGYLVHLGVVVVVVGLAGAAFNRSVEGEMALHDKLLLGPYTLECTGFTQDSNPNYDSEYALLDVSEHGVKRFQMTPEKRIYLASEQPQTMVAIHSVPGWDLYVVFEGVDSTTGLPVIKAILNPLVSWLWAGVLLMALGTLVALMPAKAVVSGQLSVVSEERAEASTSEENPHD